MTTDQLLLAHNVGSGRFEISGLRTISIRDQMVRGRLIVDRLIEEKAITAQHPLLIIGGGAGGATAALRAAERNIPVYLCEQGSLFFATQAHAERWLDPTQYDWPALHWNRGTLNQPGFATALPWQAERSDRLAQKWEVAFLNALGSSLIHVFPTKAIVRADVGAAWARGRQLVSCTHFRGVDFGAALSCVGFGSEKTEVDPRYKGFDFWAGDPYELPGWGLPPKKCSAVMSGGGDGALQDFLRLTIGSKQPGEVINLLEQRGIEIDYASILRAEDVAHRCCLWAPPSGDTHDALQAWHDAYYAVVDRLWNAMSSADQAALQDCLLPEVVREERRVWLVHGCNHFSYCYALNRFVVLLVARAYAEATGIHLDNILRWGSSVAHVEGVDPNHTCGDPSNCHGIPHHVTVASRSCQGVGGNTEGAANFEVVIIRHGVNFKPLFDDAPFPRQHFVYNAF
jgi:hypothetical protein